jgi:pyrimidine-nucleoside phosphorylase
MNIIKIIDRKRRGEDHTREEIDFLVEGMTAGSIADYQVSAWLMAVCIQGLSLENTTWLTDAFVRSGKVLDLSGVGGIVVDKHSTGGVGDKTTLALAPLLAVSGVKLAKLSGRGLGFTGGTIDKLEAIHGFKTSLTNEQFVNQVKRLGVAICGQTQDLAPADGKMYALRDVTGTVDSIPLIAASVVSKKIASGADVIVLDIKAGRGAFMKDLDSAKQLAETCRQIGKQLGKTISTVISTMNQPLGYAIGHSLEVMETVATLKGQGPKDVEELCLKLGAVALVGAGKCDTLDEGEKEIKSHLDSGEAYKKFQDLVEAQGGEVEALEDFSLLPQPDRVVMIPAPVSGYIQSIDSLLVAESAKLVGAGRLRKEDPINLGVGVLLHRKVGEYIEQGDTVAELHTGKCNQSEAMSLLNSAIAYSEVAVEPPVLIEEVYCAQTGLHAV